MKNELHHFLDVRGNNKNGRNNTKRGEKPYIHCGSQTGKVIKSTQYYLWKEVVVIKIKAKIVIMIKIILVTTITEVMRK